MNCFLNKRWVHGTFKSRPNSFGACIVSSDRGHGIVTFILARNYNGFGEYMDSSYQLHIRLRACIQRGVFVMLLGYLQNRLRSRTRMQNVSSHVVRETVRSESNRPRVLREQKVLPEVRNRPLLLRKCFNSSIFKKLVWIQQGILPFYPLNLFYTYDSKLQLEKFSESEVGALWAARRYSVRNLWFKYRGMQLGM